VLLSSRHSIFVTPSTMPTPRNSPPSTNAASAPALPFGKGLLIGNVAVFLLLLIAVGYSLQRSHEVYLARAKQTSTNLAHALSLTVSAQVKQIDNALQTVSFKLRSMQPGDSLTGTDVRHLVMEQESLVPDTDVIRVTDADGVVLNC
jgi:hypothetical protein